MEESHQRLLDNLLSALRSPEDSLPRVTLLPPSSSIEELGIAATTSAAVANASPGAADQVPSQTEKWRTAKEKKTKSSSCVSTVFRGMTENVSVSFAENNLTILCNFDCINDLDS